MCTAVSFRGKDHYFGRNLDLDASFGEQVIITPRNFPMKFRCMPGLTHHYALIGIGIVEEGVPLYYDAINEKGLGIAGLNFPGLAVYGSKQEGKDNVAPFEIIPWLLGQCANVKEAVCLLKKMNVLDVPFNEILPAASLHWMISDRDRSIVAQPLKEGLQIYENPVNVLTNNPPFEYQLLNLTGYMGLTSEPPVNRFCEKISLEPYCLGMGAIGLPGDNSSASRFVRCAFSASHALADLPEEKEKESFAISQFFHILGSVEQTMGCVVTPQGHLERTVYSSCCNTDRGIYYYRTYDNNRITAVDLYKDHPDGENLVCYPLRTGQDICYEN